MSKNNNKNKVASKSAPVKASAPVNPPAPAAPAMGAKANPYTGQNAPEDKESRAGKWLRLGNGELIQFGPEGQGPKGNWRGTGHEGGISTGGMARSLPGLLHNNNYSPAQLTGETADDYAVRVKRFTLGREMLQAVAAKVLVKTAASEGGERKVPLSEAEIEAATVGMNPKAMIAFMMNPGNLSRTVKMEASAGEVVPLADLKPGVQLEKGAEAQAVETLLTSLKAAFLHAPRA